MPHGIDGYFEELATQRRRMGRAGALVLAAALLAEAALMPRAIVESLNDPKRFGFEGEEQFVRRILLESVGDVEQAGASAQNVVPIELHRGGGGTATERPRTQGTAPVEPRGGPGPGEDDIDLRSRLRALALEGPIIRSEELVVDRLVRPEYPEEARERDIEGVVELIALVDTIGTVAEVHIVGGTHEPLLERAATDAVLQCVYRPYRGRRGLERVWAFFRITFKLF